MNDPSLCECGCGEPVKPGKRFAAGFHAIRMKQPKPPSPREVAIPKLVAANRLQRGIPRETLQFAYNSSLIKMQAGVPLTADNLLHRYMVANDLPVDWVNTASEVSQ